MTDAVVIGSGPNGLVAGNLLADAGWDVVVLEAQSTYGGSVRSDNDVAEGFVHDTFSAFYPLAAASPTVQALHLEEHGLEWVHAPAVVGNPLPGGGWVVLNRDAAATAANLDELSPGDGDAWLDLCRLWSRFGDDALKALLSPFPPIRHGLPAAVKLPLAGGLRALRLPLMSAATLARERFRSEGARLLVVGNALHADFSPDDAGSGVFGLVMCMLGQDFGFPVPRGGSSMLTEALVRRLRSLGGEVRTDCEVATILIRDGRAVGVKLVDGTEVGASKAVVADVTAPRLYGGLVAWAHLPRRTRSGMRRFEWDPSTVKVDWALAGPVPWRTAPPLNPGTVHIGDSVAELTAYHDHLRAGRVPSHPFLLTGQMTTTDPTRSPAGTESMWAYCHVPQTVVADAGPSGIRGIWDERDTGAMADRMQQRIERFAPGFSALVTARRVLGPRELESRNASLVGGAINGGTSRLRQELVLRPIPGLGRAETPIRDLYLGSASAHPGGGVHGAAGANAARAALARERLRRFF